MIKTSKIRISIKGEQLHKLARDVFYGKRGRVTARDFQQQMNTASCLILILACIIYWQAREGEYVINPKLVH
ncbi:MAG: Tn3 family transposase [Candidatus Bipolaricaulia bacterium]